jgi:ankyrin repeat protein
LRALLERRELLATMNRDADSPLSLALATTRSDRDIPAALVEAGTDLEQRNEAGHTALHQAILKEDSVSAIFLLEHGADMNARYLRDFSLYYTFTFCIPLK